MKQKLLALVLSAFVGSFLLADDWPQFRGPARDGHSKEKGLLREWPKKGPPLAWTFKKAGLGFSSVAVSKGVVYTLGTDLEIKGGKAEANDEYVIAIDEKTGAEIWRTKIAPLYMELFKKEDGKIVNVNTYGDGPRATPTVDGNLLFALSGGGQLVCLDLASKGKEVWRKHLIKDLDGVLMDKYGWSESPLVDGNLVICTPGGPKGTLAALDKTTGKVVWRSTDLTHTAPFSSPIVAEINGVRQYIQSSYDATNGAEYGAVSGFDAKSGKVLWTAKMFTLTNDLLGIATTPIVVGNQVYAATSIREGSQLFDIPANGTPTTVYSKVVGRKVKNALGGVVLVNGYVYGHSERNRWFCQDIKTGKIAWDDNTQLSAPSGSIITADGMLYLYTSDGQVGLAAADPKAFNLISSFPIPVKSNIPQMRTSSICTCAITSICLR
jgi:outer membrane protein assembly factor BamB